MIPYAKQNISARDIEAVAEVLSSDWLTQGPTVELFEREVASYCGASYAVAVTSATSALHLASLAAGVGKGDRVWTSPNSFVASANCALFCGASVDFVDIDQTLNLGCDQLEAKLARAETEGLLPKAVIPVHFGGQPCDMERIGSLARRFGFSVIEDASHAIGARYRGDKVGSCTHSDLTVFSFHPVKIITTGEGGMILTNRHDLYERLLRLRSHGITRDPQLMTRPSPPPWYYQQVELGFNYRMTEMQGALGLSQLSRLDEFVERRCHLAERYRKGLAGLPLSEPHRVAQADSSWHLYVIRLELERLRKSRRRIFEELREKGILVNVHYIPIHRQPFYEQMGFRAGDFPEAEKYYREALTLPLYFSLSYQEQDQVIAAVQEALL